MKIRICAGQKCKNYYSNFIKERLENDIERFGLENVFLEEGCCFGNCKKGPNIEIDGEIIERCTPIIASKKMFEKLKKEEEK
ncbi:MAG: (2Fe-2S) ferredoxin domain-containing protein [Candidatus Gracilibacteria bacterium]|nr:(2Fe-2S) ferredoxin domain-containing protein [Candidatus Gracilibacteria bacterium]